MFTEALIKDTGFTLHNVVKLLCFQLGDRDSLIEQAGVDTPVTVSEFLSTYFNYQSDMIGYIALILVGFSLIFFSTFMYALQRINFNKR